MEKTKRRNRSVADYAIYFLLIVLCFILFYPIYYILIASFSSPVEVVKNPILLYPKDITIYNYRRLLASSSIWMGYANTLRYVILGTAINVAITMTTAYALSQELLPCKKGILFLIIFTMFFSGGMIPTFLVVKELRMLNTVWALILPGAISTWNLMVTRTYLSTQIPKKLHEAAEIDGAGEYRTFLQIILPLAKPILIVITMFYASGHWNSWFSALIYLRDREMYPLQIIMREMLIEGETYGVFDAEASTERAIMIVTFKYAVMAISILPLMILFPFIQKHFAKGVLVGSLKG